MNNSILTLLFLVSSLFALEFNGYHNEELNNISFEESTMITSHLRFHRFPQESSYYTDDTLQPIDSSETQPNYTFEYDSINRTITSQSVTTYTLDSLRRVVSFNKRDMSFTYISYDSLQKTITVHPNTDEINYHSKEFIYRYRPDGQVASLIFIPVDWEYGQPVYWDSAHADTLTYSFNQDGLITGARYTSWSIDVSHGFPWQRSDDSLHYSYSTLDDTTIRTITQLSPSTDSWTSRQGDTLWTQIFSPEGWLVREKKQRFNTESQPWDTLYYTVKEYTYTANGKLTEHTETQHYGDGSATFVRWRDVYLYGPNTLLDPVTPLNHTVQTRATTLQYLYRNSQLAILSSAPYNEISLYNLRGQLLGQRMNSSTISLNSLTTHQTIMVVVRHNGVIVGTTKLRP